MVVPADDMTLPQHMMGRAATGLRTASRTRV